MRKLEVTFAGYWFTVLTIALGVVALMTGNNVLYLIESLLLSSMVFSGVLSEKSVSALEIEFRRTYAIARTVTHDVVRVKNKSKFPLFCVEVGEWRDDGFVCTAFIPRIEPLSEIYVDSKMEFVHRGKHHWAGLAIATSYPFGLARKIRVLNGSGERLIWPERSSGKLNVQSAGEQGAAGRVGQDFSEGEVRAYTYEDDCRNIVWTLSEKGIGHMVRTQKSKQAQPRIVLDLRVEAGPVFEAAVVQAAQAFHSIYDHIDQYRELDSEGSLIVIDDTGSRAFQGKVSALNYLAIVQPKATLKK